MLSTVSCLCVRNGSRVVPFASLSVLSTVKSFKRSLKPTEQRDLSWPRPTGLLYPPLWDEAGRFSARPVCLSADPRSPLPPPADGDSQEHQVFGTLSLDMASKRSFRKSTAHTEDFGYQKRDEEDSAKPRWKHGRRNTPYWYFLQCKKLIKQNKLQEALDMFSRDMLQGERLPPQEFNYTILIGGCGRAGQLKQAFRLYNDMKKRGLDASDATYTALFNACAETPFKETGLQQALKLEQDLRRKNYQLSTITYHALLKTHAVTNNLQACIQTLREMLEKGHCLTQETFHYLLMGCWKDKESGFRLALQVWRQMLQSGIHPDSRNYNLLLRTARDCGIGDPSLATSLLLIPSQKRREERATRSDVIDIDLLVRELFIQPDPLSSSQQDSQDTEDKSTGGNSTHLIPVRQTVPLPVALVADCTASPNLLDLFVGKRSDVISLGSAEKAEDRLALIGGADGLLEKMEAARLVPDLRTLTLLADTMKPGYSSLQLLLRVAKKHQVKLDVAFFNSAIRTATKGGDMEGAKAVLSVMQQRNVSVNVQTFGCLALGCEQQKDGLQLLKDMEAAGLKPNVQVFSALIGRASRRLDYIYLKTILKSMTSAEVWPNEVIIRQLEFAAQYPPNYDQVSPSALFNGSLSVISSHVDRMRSIV